MPYDLQTERKMREHWKKIDLLKLLEKKNMEGEAYFLLDGPPYPNNVPHVGHIRNTVYKDLYIRLAFQQGKKVLFQPGFDTHGLPIENVVEKKIGVKSKQDIEKYGIAKFVQLCKENATLFKDIWLEVYDLLGSWYSWKEPYLTYHNSYLESAWWGFQQIWNKGWVYEGKRPVTWCPHCQTALAGYEVTDSYKNVSDPSVYVKFKLKGQDAYLLVFTTTPWTLPSNVAVCVHSDKEYVKVDTNKGNLILAKKRLEFLDRIEVKYKILEEFPGRKMDGWEYEPLLNVPVQQELQKNSKALRVYMSIPMLKERVASKIKEKKGLTKKDVYEDFVTVDDGTGLVHTAPGHGRTDFIVGQHYGLPAPSPLNDECKFTDDAGVYQGEFVKDADHAIAEHLHKSGQLLHYEKIEHSYPLCWRCKTPLIFRLSNQWFIKVDPVKEKMLACNEETQWQPEFAKERLRTWASNADDWNFSRQRYWGIPIPLWRCTCGEMKVVGNLEELQENATKPVPKDFDLHTASMVELKCLCGKNMKRIPDIFDVWYDAGSAPHASLGYPKHNQDVFEEYCPVSRINESQDQIRGWFYHLMFCSVAVFDKTPFQAVSMPGWVVDEKGEKFSKSSNMLEAKKVLEQFGADALRFYYCWDIAPYELQKFSLKVLQSDVTKYFNILWNLHTYLLNQKLEEPVKIKEAEDWWILSRLNSTIQTVLNAYESFELHQAGRALYGFVIDDLSRTYVQLTRDREDVAPAHVLHECLQKMVVLTAAINPHISEQIYQNLSGLHGKAKESVHLEPLPKIGKTDEKLEQNMGFANELITATLSARDKAKLGVRWPLSELILDTEQKEYEQAAQELSAVILRQTNIKKITHKKMKPALDFKPNYNALGKTFGKETANIVEVINKNKEIILEQLQNKKPLKLEKWEFQENQFDTIRTAPEGYQMAGFKGGYAYIDLKLTPELESEGYTRELVRRIQQLRKEQKLTKQDLIKLTIATLHPEILEKHQSEIQHKVGAKTITIKNVFEDKAGFKEETIRGKAFQVIVEKV
ncbi:MAG TPA: isoleucine--tRNA ligase [Candidatus Nanoarchaeia archaeon]|nr:isoleucine--tRNA ligase [Candidatus Nanoarchaeia archaeon]